MKSSFHVFWTSVAEEDLIGIVEFLTDDDPGSATRILKKIKTAAEKLDHSPMRGRVVPELREQGISRYREIIVKPWRMIYRVQDKNVYILAVIDARRNVEDLLLLRFLR